MKLSQTLGHSRTLLFGTLVAGAVGAIAVIALSLPARAAGDTIYIDKQDWTFSGFFGHYDAAQLQRGYRVYKEVCASCHGLKLVAYRDLASEHGPHFSADAVKVLAGEATVIDGVDDEGEPLERPGIPADRFVSPFPNDQTARAANGGALPPDLSLITKARNAHQKTSFAPLTWANDIVTGYQEGGADYLYALMTKYEGDEPNEGGLYKNTAFSGHQIAMAPPLSEGLVEYTDDAPATVDQYARDVSAFLMWAAEPKLEERKQLGIRVLIYLLILSVLLYLAKRRTWSRIEH